MGTAIYGENEKKKMENCGENSRKSEKFPRIFLVYTRVGEQRHERPNLRTAPSQLLTTKKATRTFSAGVSGWKDKNSPSPCGANGAMVGG